MERHLTWKRFFKSRLFFVVGVVLLLLLSASLTRAQIRDRAIRQEIASLQAEVTALEKEQAERKALLSLLETPEFLEKEARRTLGYARPGEQVVVVEDRGLGTQEEEKEKRMSNPRKWWIYFFGDI